MDYFIPKDRLDSTKLTAVMKWDRFPRSAKYDALMAGSYSMGMNVLWLTEALTEIMDIRSEMRILDLGSGYALSSIFLAQEFDVEVWAVDLWVSASDSWKLIQENGVDDKVIPLHCDARFLPFANDFFDAVVSLDAYHYFGTDVEYLKHHLLPLVKPRGQIGIVSPAAVAPLPFPLPADLPSWVYLANSVDWWQHHWDRNPEISIQTADALPGGRDMWIRWNGAKSLSVVDSGRETQLLKSQIGECLGFVRLVAHKNR